MKGFRFIYIGVVILTIFTPLLSFALRESQPLSVDKRLRVMVYNPNDVFKFTGFYGYESSIVFAQDEQIDTITMGDSVAWQIVPNANRMFLKPVEQEATTNMTVITDKRVYHFELHADDAQNINDPDMVFSVKFLYPDDGGAASTIQHFSEGTDSDSIDKKNLNYDYTISGPELLTPIKVFDDGKFTYFEFNEAEAELPAFFVVYEDYTEGLVNFKVVGKQIIVERVAQRFTLRKGNDVGCVFNENLIAQAKTNAKIYKYDEKKEKTYNIGIPEVK